MAKAKQDTVDLVKAAEGIAPEMKAELEKEMAQDDAQAALSAVPTEKGVPITTSVDELGMADPSLDISPFIEYYFYKCTSCGRKVMAGAGEVEHAERKFVGLGVTVNPEERARDIIESKLECECTCRTGQFDKHRYFPGTKDPRPIYGTMKLHHFKVKRPVR